MKYIYFPLLSLVLYFIFFNVPLQLNNTDKKADEVLSIMTYNVKAFGSTNDFRNLAKSKDILEFIKGENP
ncbi:MAG: hypothetical protein WBN21_10905, partial [Algibacter sp.]